MNKSPQAAISRPTLVCLLSVIPFVSISTSSFRFCLPSLYPIRRELDAKSVTPEKKSDGTRGGEGAGVDNGTVLVHSGVVSSRKTVRQSVSLPANVAAQVRGMAKTRRLSSNRMLVELIENGIASEKRKQEKFFELAERFRSATDPEEAQRLGDELGRMVFGN
jgi:hypothetical protein